MATYEIGGVSVFMTDAQADRWNRGDTTAYDLRRVVVAVPMPQNHARYITLRRATSWTLEPAIAAAMDGMQANRISGQLSLRAATARKKITKVNMYKGEDNRWYYSAWSGTELDRNDSIPDAESETEAVEWVRSQWPHATVKLAS